MLSTLGKYFLQSIYFQRLGAPKGVGLPKAGEGAPNDWPPKGDGLDCANEPKPPDAPKPGVVPEPKVCPEALEADIAPNDGACPKPPELCPKGLGDPIIDCCPNAGVAVEDPNPDGGAGAVGEIPKTEGLS